MFASIKHREREDLLGDVALVDCACCLEWPRSAVQDGLHHLPPDENLHVDQLLLQVVYCSKCVSRGNGKKGTLTLVFISTVFTVWGLVSAEAAFKEC